MAQFDYIITTALPYANGPTHLGHLVEHIQADIWVRFQKMNGKTCLYLSGDDAHGTPIMLSSQKNNQSPEEMINAIHKQRLLDFKAFGVSHDHYYTSHSPENKKITHEIFATLQGKGLITTEEIEQLYDAKEKMFLPDRYVKGQCPSCSALDQYGDNCEKCGHTYPATALINPCSVLSNTAPITKKSLHYFFQLPKQKDILTLWLDHVDCQKSVVNKLKEWFSGGLKAWDISRDAPYFGFNIPGEKDKYFYVWLDAPIGYIATLEHYLKTHYPQVPCSTIWGRESDSQIIHFVGKDIIYFHGLFWPAVLAGADYALPSALYAHGFLTINGQKMSKSRGTFITAQQYCAQLSPEYFRYFLASKLNDSIEDIDLSWPDFTEKIHADLIGKFINIPSRCCKFIHQYFNSTLSQAPSDLSLLEHCVSQSMAIQKAYQDRQFSHAIRMIMSLADEINQMISQEAPWTLVKNPDTCEKAHIVCSLALQCFACVANYLAPVMPELTLALEDLLHCSLSTQWWTTYTPLWEKEISPYTHLLKRIDPQATQALSS